MKRMLILIGRDFFTRVKTSSFIITTILGVIVFIGLTFVPTIMELINTKMSSSTTHLAVVDRTDFAYSVLADVTSQMSTDNSLVTVERLYATEEEHDADMVNVALSEGKDGLLVIDSVEHLPSLQFTYYVKNATSITHNSLVQDLVNRVKVAKMSIDMQLEPSQMAELMSSASLRIVQIQTGEQGESVTGEELDSEQHFLKMALAYFLLFMIYMSLAMYGNMVASGVAEEKSNRIMEIMISTVKPVELMAGKIIGVGSLAMLQFGIWITVALIMNALSGTGLIANTLGEGFSLSTIPIGLLVWFGVLFILGFLLYATIFAAGGAIVSRVEDVNQISTMIMLFLIVGFMLAYASFINPNGVLAVVCSFIPLLAPMTMFSRIALGNPPVYQILISLCLMLCSIGMGIVITSRIYRIGVLMYGKAPRIKEIIRYVRER